MSVLNVGGLTKYYGAELIFRDISFPGLAWRQDRAGWREWRRQINADEDNRRGRVK